MALPRVIPQPVEPRPLSAYAPGDGVTAHSRQVGEQLASLRTSSGNKLRPLACLGEHRRLDGMWGAGQVAYLVIDEATGALLVATLSERRGQPGAYDITLWRELDEALPGPASPCLSCNRAVRGWRRFCSCGTDLSGLPLDRANSRADLERVRQATTGELDLLGAIPYAGRGGLAFFARQADGHAIVALRMHADGTFDDGTQRISLTVSDPLGEIGGAPSPEVDAPASVSLRIHSLDSIRVVPDETTARQRASATGTSGQTKAAPSSPSGEVRSLPGSILGSGLLAQQPTPSGQDAVAVAKVCPQCGAEYDTASRFCPNDGTPLRPKGSADPFVGRVLAERYHMLKRLGEGGMGRVYLAEHVKMNRQCAVKVMSGALVNDSESAQRFAREASNAARIIHPNVAAVFDYGESEGVVYLVMEYVDGEPLTHLLTRETAVAPSRAVDIARQVAEGLVAAHELGIVHRDLKPDNIIIASAKNGREIAKVVDFGIAKAVEEGPNEALTRTGLVIGTPEYMSPEQLLGDPVDARTDLYSLGCILYQMLTGRRIFDEPTREQMIKRRLTERAPHPRDLIPDLPKTLDLIVTRLLAKSPQDRYSTAAEVRDLLIPAIALEGGFDDPSWTAPAAPKTRSNPTIFIHAAEQPTQEMTPVAGVPVPRSRWRQPRVIAAAAAVIVVASGASALAWRARTTDAVVPQEQLKYEIPPPNLTPIRTPEQPSVSPSATKSRLATGTSTSVATVPNGATPGARPVDAASAAANDSREDGVPRAMQEPIEAYAQAIDSHYLQRVVAAYPGLKDNQVEYRAIENLLNTYAWTRSEVRFVSFYATSPQLVDVRFQLTTQFGTRPSIVTSSTPRVSYHATLTREGRNAPWKIQELKRENAAP